MSDKKEQVNCLTGYADASWAQDEIHRISNSGYIFQFNNSTISWACRKQSCVVLSSTEAEYVALAEACQEATWIKRLIKDFGITENETTTIYKDNQSCLKLIDSRLFSNRTKHIDTKYHYLKDLKSTNTMNFVYCPTSDMLARYVHKTIKSQQIRNVIHQMRIRTMENLILSSRRSVSTHL